MVLPPACSGSRAPRTCLQKGRDVPSQPPPGTSVGITSLTQRLPTKSHQIAPCTLSRRVQMCPQTRRQRLVETEGDKAHFAAAESLLSKKGIQLATTLPETSLPQRTEFCSCRAWSALTYLSSHCRAPLSHLRGHQLLGPSLSSFRLFQSPTLAAAMGGPRSPGTCELGLGSPQQGCLEEEREAAALAAAAAAAVVLMRLLWLWNSATAPLSAQQLPGRGLFRGSPGEAGPGGKAANAGEKDPPPPLRKGKKGPSARARARALGSRPLASLTSAPSLLPFPRRDAARPRHPARSAPSRPGEPFLPPTTGPVPRSPAQRPEAARRARRRGAPFPQPRPSPPPVGDGSPRAGPDAQEPDPARPPARPV